MDSEVGNARLGVVDEARWRERAEQLRNFLDTEGRWPRRRGADRHEAALAVWLVNQRLALRQGRLSVDRTRHLERAVPGWHTQPARRHRWQRQLEAAVEFREQRGHRPRTDCDDADEKALGVWLSNQRSLAARGALREDRRRELDRRLPDWEPFRPGSASDGEPSADL